jgi:preprotein translocase subunit SecG
MKDLKEAKLLDFIIKKMIEHKEQTRCNSYSYHFILDINHKLKKDNDPYSKEVPEDNDKSEYLFKLIFFQEFKGNTIMKSIGESNNGGYMGDLHYNTYDFLNAGGFKLLYETENKKYKKKIDKDNYDFKNSKNQAILSTRQKFTFWITFAFAVSAFVLSIYNTFFKSIE